MRCIGKQSYVWGVVKQVIFYIDPGGTRSSELYPRRSSSADVVESIVVDFDIGQGSGGPP